LNKPQPLADDDHVDGVKIAFTAKASCQIGFGFSGALKFVTQRAKESKIAFTEL
jgi:hypothetical protein